MQILAGAAAVTLVSTLGGFWTPGFASPDVSWSSNDVVYAQSLCMERAKATFAREGWVNIHTRGQLALAAVAHKESLAAVILCVDRVIGADHSVAVVFVAGGDATWGPTNGTGWSPTWSAEEIAR